jgi:hypothetical protein
MEPTDGVSGPAASVPFDARPLVDPVDRNAVREYVRRLRASGAATSMFGSAATVVPIIIGIAFFVVFGSVFLTVIGSIIRPATWARRSCSPRSVRCFRSS